MDTDTARDPGVRIVVGGYTEEMNGSAPGLASYLWYDPPAPADPQDPTGPAGADPAAVEITAQPALPLRSPSWVVAHPDRDVLYAATESDPAQVHAVVIGGDGHLADDAAPAGRQPTGGSACCHLALTPDAGHLVAANYGDGSVAAFPIGDDGSLGERTGWFVLDTQGPDTERQEHGHAHQVVMDGDGFWVADLGGDVVHRLRLDAEGRIVTAGPAVQLPPGSGPRHLVLTGDHMVVACELSAEVWLGRRDGQTYRQVAVVDAHTATDHTATDDSGTDTATDAPRVYPSGIGLHESPECGRQVIVANRGCDTVTVFALDPDADTLTAIEEFDTVVWPRDLLIDGDRLWVAGQSADRVATWLLDRDTGRWAADFEFPAPSPACILLLR